MRMKILKWGDDPGLSRCPASSQVPCKREQEFRVREGDVMTESEFGVRCSQATGYGQFLEAGIGKAFISPVETLEGASLANPLILALKDWFGLRTARTVGEWICIALRLQWFAVAAWENSTEGQTWRQAASPGGHNDRGWEQMARIHFFFWMPSGGGMKALMWLKRAELSSCVIPTISPITTGNTQRLRFLLCKMEIALTSRCGYET